MTKSHCEFTVNFGHEFTEFSSQIRSNSKWSQNGVEVDSSQQYGFVSFGRFFTVRLTISRSEFEVRLCHGLSCRTW